MIRYTTKRSLSIAAAVLVLAVLGAGRVAATETEARWYVIEIQGTPVGTASEVLAETDGGVRYVTHMSMSMARMGAQVSMVLSANHVEDARGRVTEFNAGMKASTMEMRFEGELVGDTLVYRTIGMGHTREDRIVWEDGAMGEVAADAFVRERWEAGDREVTVRVFDVQSGTFKSNRIVIGDRRPATVRGRELEVIEVESFEGDSEVPLATSWVTPGDFEAVRTVFVQMGLEIVLESVDESEVASLELEPNFDIIRQSMISVEGFPADPGAVEWVTYRIEFPRAGAADRDFTGPNQSVEKRGTGWVELKVTRETSVTLTEDPATLDTFLDADRYIQSDHAEVVAVADSVRAETGAGEWELARALAAWVNGYIDDKNYEQGFASALEVLQTKAGDCTEHSLLLTALLRAAGIPARPAVGLAYTDGQLIGHMWAEAYVDGWRTLDALDLAGDPIRIRVSSSDDGSAVDETDLVEAYSLVGGISVRVVDSETRGR